MKAISVEQARKAVLRGVKPLGAETLPLAECLGRIPVGEVRSPYDYPLRDVSAMDGFAYRFRDIREGKGPVLVGERTAGQAAGRSLAKGEAVRIMTGAPLPPGADTVTPKERARLEGGTLRFEGSPKKGEHVRYRGEGMRKGRKLQLPSGPLSDRALGFLASLGIASVKVRRRPTILLLVTGNELVPPGRRPGKRFIFESNGLMLKNSLELMGLSSRVKVVRDSPSSLRRAVAKGLREADVLLTTGGVSVGERDWAKEAFRKVGIRQVFWRVAQKPGGPMYFGRKGGKAIFGLPGNPAAVYSCFQLYVRSYLEALLDLPTRSPWVLPLAHPLEPLGKKTFFVKAKLSGSNGDSVVKVLGGQGSHLLGPMALGDGLLEVPPGKKKLKAGTRLRFYPFQEGRR